MSVIQLDDFRRKGNGAREALIEHMSYYAMNEQDLEEIGEFIDVLLARLWLAGYKIVPLEEKDRASEPEIYA